MNNQLQTIIDSVKSEFTVLSDGKSYLSYNAVARLLDLHPSTIYNNLVWFKDCGLEGSEMPETFTTQGLERVGLNDIPQSALGKLLYDNGFRKNDFSTGVPDTAFAIIAHYYSTDAQRTTELAKQVCKAFLAIGVRAWAHQITGWQEQDRLKELENTVSQMAGMFTQMCQNQMALNQSLADITAENTVLRENVDEYEDFHRHLRNSVSGAEVLVKWSQDQRFDDVKGLTFKQVVREYRNQYSRMYSVMNRARHNVSGLYNSMTGKYFGRCKGRLVFTGIEVAYCLLVLDKEYDRHMLETEGRYIVNEDNLHQAINR